MRDYSRKIRSVSPKSLSEGKPVLYVVGFILVFIALTKLVTDITSKVVELSNGSKAYIISEKDSYRADETPNLLLKDPYYTTGKVGNVLGQSTNFNEKITATLINPKNAQVKGVTVDRVTGGNFKVSLPEKPNIIPGKYKLQIKYSDKTVTKDFTWGVLAVNTHKSVYTKGEKVKFQIASLDSAGHTLCDSNLILTVTNPKNKSENIDIKKSGKCDGDNVTDVPDYFAEYKAEKTGIYKMYLKNQDNNYSIEDTFEVRRSVPFSIERTGPTRIYPYADYTMSIKIKANRNFKGEIVEKMPAMFQVNEKTETLNGYRYLKWDVELKKGETKVFKYVFNPPNLSPELYATGPLTIGSFEEYRSWQIAADAVQTVTEVFASSGSWTAPPGVTSAVVKAWGGGGTGGAATGNPASGGGGAGGQFASKTVSVTPIDSYNFTVSGVTTSVTGSVVNGGDTTFNTSEVVAKGGAGGLRATANSSTSSGGTGSTTGGVGDVVYAGGSGGNGVSTTQSGGGGGGAGDTGTGDSGSGATAGDATSENGGAGGNGVSSANTRNAGSLAGGGGSGGLSSSSTDRRGGDGAGGLLSITYDANYPKVESTSSDFNGSNSGSHAITMPSGITVGDLLIIVFSSDGAPTVSIDSGDWTKLGQLSHSTVTTQAVFYKVAEGSDTATVTTSANEQTTHIVYRISGASGVVTGTSTNGSSTNSNPPDHDATTAQSYLWIATRGGDSTTVASVAPTSFTNMQTQAASGTGGASTNTAEAFSYRQTYDPDTWTSSNEQWVSYTLAIEPQQPVTLSGIVYTDRGINDIGSGKTVNLRVNGEGSYTTETNADGEWEITPDFIAEDDVITLYLDGETEKGTTVVVSDGTEKDDLHIFQNMLSLRSDNGSPIIPDHLYEGDDADSDVLYSVSASTNGNLTVNSGIELYIWGSGEFNSSGGTVTTQSSADLYIGTGSTATLDTNTNTISGNIIVNGTGTLVVNADTNITEGSIVTSGTGATVTTSSGSPTVTLNGTGTIGGGTDDDITLHTISVANGITTTVASSLIISGGEFATAGSGSITYTGTPTVQIEGEGNIGGGSSTIYFYNLNLGDSSSTQTSDLASNISIANQLVVNSAHTFDFANNNVTVGSTSITNSGDILINGETSQSSSGTLTILSGSESADLSGSGNLNIYNLTIGNSSDTVEVNNTTLAITTANNVTITTNSTYSASETALLTVGGNYLNSGNFISNDGAVMFNASDGGNTLDGSMTGSNSFHDILFDNSDGSWDILENITTTNDFTISDATEVSSPSTITVDGDFQGGTSFNANTGTVVLNNTSETQTVRGSSTFYNLLATATQSRLVQFQSSTTTRITNNLTLTGSNCHAILLLRSTTKGSYWNLDDDSGGTTDVTFVDVQDSNATDQAVTGDTSINSGHNANWNISPSNCAGASTTETPTANSFQRKTFFDETNERHWIFFNDGNEIEAKYSTNNGTTWNTTSTDSNSHISYNTNDFSVWSAPISGSEYVFLIARDGFDVKLRVGVLSENNITWDNDVSAVFNGTSSDHAYSNPYITLDSSNYIWVSVRHKDESTYIYEVARSNQVGNVDLSSLTWQEENQLSGNQVSENVYGNILALSNRDMYTVFAAGNNLKGCLWNNTESQWEDSNEFECIVESEEEDSNWYDGDWSYRTKLTIDSDKVISEIAPEVESTSSNRTTGDETSHPITMPSGITAGDLLIIIFSVDGDPTASIGSGGWTKLGQESNSTSTTQAIFYKTAAGGDTATVSTTSSQESSHIVYRISGATGVLTGTASNGDGSDTEPPLHDTSVTGNYLWLATRGGDSTTIADLAPLGFTDMQTQAANTSSGASTTVTQTVSLSSSLDPLEFDSSSEQWVSYTLAIQPSQSEEGSLESFPLLINNTRDDWKDTENGGKISAHPNDLLVIVVTSDGSPTISITDGGWTKLGQASNSTTVTQAIFYKVAEGNDTAIVTTTASEQASYVIYRIKGSSGIVEGTSANGNSTNSNPPNYDAGSTATRLWLATRGGDSTVVASAEPSGFSNMQTIIGRTSSGASTNTAQINHTGSSLDPGTWTSGTEQWVSYTLAISPAIEGTYPTVEAISSGSDFENATNHAIDMPTGTKAGRDILFTSADGLTKLSHEIERYEPSTGQLVAWVQVDEIDYLADTEIYMYYGNPNSDDQTDVATTWSEYKAVWHLNEESVGGTDDIKDSTALNHHLTSHLTESRRTTLTDALIGKGHNFDAANFQFLNREEITTMGTYRSTHTISVWYKAEEYLADDIARLVRFRDVDDISEHSIWYDRDDFTIEVGDRWNEPYTKVIEYASPPEDVWNHIVYTWNGTDTNNLYINGSKVASSSIPPQVENLIEVVRIGNASTGATTGNEYFNGDMDEIRLAGVDRSPIWVNAEYNNQIDPEGFFSDWGEEEVFNDWYNTSWEFRSKLTVDHTKVSNFPIVAATSSNRTTGNETSHSITMPSGIEVGDLLLIVFSVDGNPTTTSIASGNWTKLGEDNNSSNVKQAVFWKIAEGSDTATVSTGATSEESSHIVYRIQGADSVTGSSVNLSSGSGDPPNHDAGSEKDYLWIAARGGDSQATATEPPTGFRNLLSSVANTSGGATTSTAISDGYMSSNNPDSFVTTGSEQYVTWTLAVHPTSNPEGYLESFPVLVSNTLDQLKSTTYGGNVGKSNGGDILFTSSDGNLKLNHELEEYDEQTGKILAWVEVPRLYYTVDTDIYMYYGNPDATNQWNIAGTWDQDIYKGVWHLKEIAAGGSDEFLDSTTHNQHLSTSSTPSRRVTQVDGVIGKAQNFASADGEYLSRSSMTGLGTFRSTQTVSFWYRVESNPGSLTRLFTQEDSTFSYTSSIYMDGTGQIGAGDTWEPPYTYWLSTPIPSQAQWNHVAWSWNGTQSNLYINGVQINSNTVQPNTDQTSSVIFLGAICSAATGCDNLNGNMDEVRYASTERSQSWMRTEYNNQDDPESFFSHWSETEFAAHRGGWTGNTMITIDSTKVTDDLTDFPVYVDLSNLPDTFHSSVNQTDGRDIRITKGDGVTILPREVVFYDSGTDTGELHFKYNGTLSSTVDTDIYIYYGKASATEPVATSGTGKNSVWDDNYVAVYHLQETGNGTSGEYKDSTRNALNGTGGSGTYPSPTPAKLGNGQSFDGNDDIINVGDISSTFDLKEVNPDSFTISAWFNKPSGGGGDLGGIKLVENNHVRLIHRNISNRPMLMQLRPAESYASTNTGDNAWYHAAGGYNSSSNLLKLQVNSVDSTPVTPTDKDLSGATMDLRIGNAQNTYLGTIDEVRISRIDRPTTWSSTEYNNQNSPATFFLSWGHTGDTIATIDTDLSKSFSAVKDSENNIHIATFIDDTTDELSHFKWTESTKTWGPPTLIPSSASNNHIHTSLAIDNSLADEDNLYITWVDTSDDEIYLREYDNSEASWETVESINDSGVNRYPVLNFTNDGRIFLISTKGDSSPTTVNYQSIKAPVGGSSPVVTGVSVNGGSTITLTEGTTTSVSWTATVTDADGHADIESATGTLYKSGVTDANSCTPNQANCYEAPSCSLSGCSGSSCTATCTANVQFFADPTDTGSTYEAEYWRGWIEATDATSNIGAEFSSAGSPDLASLSALNITSSINYGPLLPGDDTGSSPELTTITNTGNTSIDTEVSGDNLCTNYPTCSGPQIGVGYQEFDNTTFTYGAGIGLDLTPDLLEITLPKATAAPSNSTTTLYWGLAVPVPKEEGNYTGQNIVSAVNSDG